jgi:hypothetical protein
MVVRPKPANPTTPGFPVSPFDMTNLLEFS